MLQSPHRQGLRGGHALSLSATKDTSWAFIPVGVSRPASMICAMTCGGTSRPVNCRMLRLVRMADSSVCGSRVTGPVISTAGSSKPVMETAAFGQMATQWPHRIHACVRTWVV